MSFSVVIPSADANNLISCWRALQAFEPSLPASKILVVDDGARAETPGVPVTWVDGEKPFIFARNVNRGIAASGQDDVVLLNDDAVLVSERGLTRLAERLADFPDVGICAPEVRGTAHDVSVTTPYQGHPDLRLSPILAFACVYIPRRVLDAVGPLDERFVGYGFEDFDYCERVTRAGYQLAIWNGCTVDHWGHSTFRRREDWGALYRHGRQLYREKWGYAGG